MRLSRCVCALLVALVAIVPSAAQAQKKPLTQADWDRWQTINGAALSPDGKWVAYTQNPRVGDGEFIVHSTAGNAEYRVNLGYTQRENNTPGGERGRGGAAPGGGGGRGGRGGGGGGPSGLGPFSADGKFAFVTVSAMPRVQVDSMERANRGRGAGRGRAGGGGDSTGAANAASLRIIRLADGNVETVRGARSFRLPEASGKWVAYSVQDTATGASGANDAAAAAPAAGGRGGRGGRGGGGGAGPANAGRRSYGSPMILRNLDTGAEERVADVTSYTFDDSAHVLAYTITSRDSTKDGVYLRDLATGAAHVILNGPGNYRAFTFDRPQKQFVFTSDRDDFGKPNAQPTLYYGTVKGGTAQALLTTGALPTGYRFPNNFSASFTRAGNAVTVSIAPPAEEAVPADSLAGKARFDLWHYKDVQIQPTQLLQVQAALNRTYQGIVNIATKKFTRLTDENFPNVT